MDNTYKPDKWAIIKINSEEGLYKVVGSWCGGYLKGDSWRINSGITNIKEEDNTLIFEGYSGSLYYCNKAMYGVTLYTASVLDQTILSGHIDLLTKTQAFTYVNEILNKTKEDN